MIFNSTNTLCHLPYICIYQLPQSTSTMYTIHQCGLVVWRSVWEGQRHRRAVVGVDCRSHPAYLRSPPQPWGPSHSPGDPTPSHLLPSFSHLIHHGTRRTEGPGQRPARHPMPLWERLSGSLCHPGPNLPCLLPRCAFRGPLGAAPLPAPLFGSHLSPWPLPFGCLIQHGHSQASL